MRSTSELAALVETEQRLDQAVASARSAADATREAARERARVEIGQLETSIEAERVRIAQAMEADATERERAIAQEARTQIARFEAVRAQELDRIAGVLARRLIAIALEEP